MSGSAHDRTTRRQVCVGNVIVGGDALTIMAGPCSVEDDYLDHAHAVAAAGADVLRGCVYKPRTNPSSFQGLGTAGLPLISAARRRTGMPVLAEPLSVDHIDHLHPHADALLIGARSMQNFPLLRAVGECDLPVILKRGLSATIDEWLGAVEYVVAGGNDQIILCERGIRTFEPATRSTLDLSAIPVLRERTGLPIIVDPSHAAGNRRWVSSLALAAVGAGADGLLIEAHPSPDSSWSDAAQAITPTTLATIVRAASVLRPLVHETAADSVADCRTAIDAIDAAVFLLLERRVHQVATVQGLKRAASQPVRDEQREQAIRDRALSLAPTLGPTGVARLVSAVIDACLQSSATLAVDRI